MSKKNVVVAQSGGPSAVINNSLRGVVDYCMAHPETFGTVYGAWHGVEGILYEELMDVSAQDPKEIALLRTTPAAGAVGTCRYKLKEKNAEDFDRVIEVFKAHDVGYFFYIGGNDSMDTAHKVSVLADEKGLDLIAVGVPKTIDNDVGDTEFKLIDHTPGYGSIARYWSHVVQNANEENRGSSPADPVLVLQAMGRKIGYIPAAARLADPDREMPLQIYTAEAGIPLGQLYENVCGLLKSAGRAILVVSEGYDVGESESMKDDFGHTHFGATTSSAVQVIVNALNQKGLPVPGKARGQVYGTDQRNSIIYASNIDLDEAYLVGQKAGEIAQSGENGWMATILRKSGAAYGVTYDKVPLEKVANSERTFPAEWLSADKVDVTDDFIDYVRPLAGVDWVDVPMENGLQRFTRFKKVFAEKKCGEYVPVTYR